MSHRLQVKRSAPVSELRGFEKIELESEQEKRSNLHSGYESICVLE